LKEGENAVKEYDGITHSDLKNANRQSQLMELRKIKDTGFIFSP